MNTLVVGDIHGCWAEFRELLDKAALGADDPIIAIGDIVDRGPDSPQVLAFFRENSQAVSVMGNHERKHIRSFNGELRPAVSQTITRAQIGEPDYPAAIEYMQTMPRFMDLPEALLVHGFYEPGIPVEAQRDVVLIGTLTGEIHLKKNYNLPWYELYDGPKPLIVGHHDYLSTGEPMVYQDRVFAIDTGCCKGGRLTGLLLPSFTIISVPSKRDYWAEVREAYRPIWDGTAVSAF